MAFGFAKVKVDIAVIEVGMGEGRFG